MPESAFVVGEVCEAVLIHCSSKFSCAVSCRTAIEMISGGCSRVSRLASCVYHITLCTDPHQQCLILISLLSRDQPCCIKQCLMQVAESGRNQRTGRQLLVWLKDLRSDHRSLLSVGIVPVCAATPIKRRRLLDTVSSATVHAGTRNGSSPQVRHGFLV